MSALFLLVLILCNLFVLHTLDTLPLRSVHGSPPYPMRYVLVSNYCFVCLPGRSPSVPPSPQRNSAAKTPCQPAFASYCHQASVPPIVPGAVLLLALC